MKHLWESSKKCAAKGWWWVSQAAAHDGISFLLKGSLGKFGPLESQKLTQKRGRGALLVLETHYLTCYQQKGGDFLSSPVHLRIAMMARGSDGSVKLVMRMQICILASTGCCRAHYPETVNFSATEPAHRTQVPISLRPVKYLWTSCSCNDGYGL